MKKPRYLPHKKFPSYIFVPGENPHPKKSGGHMEGEEDPLAQPLNPEQAGDNEWLRYSLDLFNHGYFWESHVYLEALWNAHAREGSTADFLKGMIKLAAAGVKLSIGQKESAKGHFQRAKELFLKVSASEGPEFLGFNLKKITTEIDHSLEEDGPCFEVHPSWE